MRASLARFTDPFIAIALAAASLVAARGEPPVSIVFDAASALLLVFRRRAPLVMAAGVAVLSVGQARVPDHTTMPALAALLFAFYSLGAWEPSLTRSAGALVALTAAANADLIVQGLSSDDFWPMRFLFISAMWGAGCIAQRQRRRVGEMAEEREVRAAVAVAEERTRLARELHDVVAHSVSVMVVQAGAAEEVLDTYPDKARESLRTIQRSGRQAIAELRRLLGILRDGDAAIVTAPQPTLAQLDELVEETRGTGTPVSVTIEGAPRPLAPGLELSVYRIVQEALTNVVRHAGPAEAHVVVRWNDDSLELRITDNGRGAAKRESGHGLVGIKERVALFGGTFEAGNRSDGGFALRAVVPLDGVTS
jgi:signal transduction histidine kinase